MTATLTPTPKQQFFDANGNPLVGGKLYSYVAGTTSPLVTYVDSDQVTTNTNPIILDSRGEANVWLAATSYKLKLVSATDVEIWTVDNIAGAGLADQQLVNQITATYAASNGSSLVGYLPAGTGAVATTVQTKLRESVSVFDYMTAAEIAAVQAYSFATDVTAKVQAALNAAWVLKADLFAPAGGYLVTGLTLPGNYNVLDERFKALRFYGQGYGNPFSTLNTGGTVFKSVTDAPVLTDNAVTAPNAQGTFEVDHIRFDGTSITPVVLLNSFYGISSFHNNVIYQRGVGDGLKIIYGATGYVYENYSINKDFAVFGLGAARTGVGFNFPNSYDAGLMTFRKNSSRGWLDGYIIGGGAGAAYSAKITECEASTVYNGITLAANTNKAVVTDSYLEGGDGGIGITNLGSYNTVRGNLIFPGFATLIQDTSTSNIGSDISGNVVSIGAVVNGIGIDITSSAAFGGNGKNVTDNSVVYTAGTNGVNGIKISGTDPRITCVGNVFSPRAAWTGTSTFKINDTSSNGVYGFTTKTVGNYEIPFLSKGAIALFDGNSTLTQTDVTANTLTISDAGSYYICSATGAATVQIISAGVTPGRLVTFRTTTVNMTFTNTAYIKLAGAVSFSGPGTITFLIERIGASNYAYEISRSVF